jgi:hypothetical protein
VAGSHQFDFFRRSPRSHVSEGAAGRSPGTIKKHNERFVAEDCDDCGAPLSADPSGELVHAEPEDTPQGDEHFP